MNRDASKDPTNVAGDVRVRVVPQEREITVRRNALLLDALRAGHLDVVASCGGRGACGHCRVRFLSEPPVPTQSDRRALSEEELEAGWRLACQHRLSDSVEVWVGFPSTSAADTKLKLGGPGRSRPMAPGCGTSAGYGVALDLGTTTLVGHLIDLTSHDVVSSLNLLNSQIPYGADVVARIAHASTPEGQRHLVATLQQDVRVLVSSLLDASGVKSQALTSGWIAGNPTMLHFLTGADPSSLGRAPFAPRFRGGLSIPAADLGVDAAPGTVFSTAPIVSGFVGSDAVCAAVFAGLGHTAKTVLMIDIGTNAEILLAHAGRLYATSAAAGPAFEGVGISCGVPARAGAVFAVKPARGLQLETIGETEPAGFCGTGLIDLVAVLLESGLIAPSGKLVSDPDAEAALAVEVQGDRVALRNTDLSLTQKDVRVLQLAVGAMRVAIHQLMSAAGITSSDVKSVIVTGTFGFSLSPGSMCALGLIDPGWQDLVTTSPNAAGEGAVQCLLSKEARGNVQEIAARIRFVELETSEAFQDRFVAALRFPDPLLGERCSQGQARETSR